MTKERIDRQLAGQSSSTPLMNIKDGYASKRVTFDTQDGLEEKIDRLTSMMSKLTIQDNSQNKQFKPKIYQGKRRGQTETFMIDITIMREIIKIGIDQIVEIGEYCLVKEYNMERIIEIALGIIRIIEMILGEELLGEI